MNAIGCVLCFLWVGLLLGCVIVLIDERAYKSRPTQSIISGERIYHIEREARLALDWASEAYLAQVESLFQAQLERIQIYDSQKK